MRTLIARCWKNVLKRSVLAPVLAIAMVASFTTYELARPAAANAAANTRSAAALDDNSVAALLALDNAMETVAARVTPAVVNVAVTSRGKAQMAQDDAPEDMQRFFGQFFGHNMRPQQPRIEHGIGSGVVLSPDGYIVTNNHVVDGAVDIRVTTSDKRVWPAKLVGADPLTDLAVIKVNSTNMANIGWGDSTKLRPGQMVLAFGNPMGLRFTVTRGIVSALNRPNPFGNDARKPGGFIQTDAAINPGNSGGALVNAHGEVVGINTFLLSSNGGFSGMGFAIPAQIARPVVDSLIRHGKVNRAYMGVGISDITPENAQFFDVTDNSGAVITQVEPNSPGARAGLKVGDVIKALDGKEVTDAGQLQVAIQEKQPDTKITLEVLRDGKQVNVPVTLEAMGEGDSDGNDSATQQNGKSRWGIGLSDLTPEIREQMQVPSNIHGAIVGRVQPGSPADDAGLSRGDIIVQVNRRPMQSAEDVQQAFKSIAKGKDALVLVWSNGGSTFRVLRAPEES
jgi:serine protease Do